jgi:hypothetical protein
MHTLKPLDCDNETLGLRLRNTSDRGLNAPIPRRRPLRLELAQRLDFDLTNALPGQLVLGPDLFERARFTNIDAVEEKKVVPAL